MIRGLRARASGHAWTVWPQVAARWKRPRAFDWRAWETSLEDPDVGRVRLQGELYEVAEADTLTLVVHGLGGEPASYYCRQAARELQARGSAVLNLALRGADREGTDYYNVAQSVDLHAALASPELARFAHVYVLGFSMGGHVALHFAADEHDARVRGVAALCCPLQLAGAQLHLDSWRAAFYRRHVLRGLKEIYASVAQRREVPTPVEEVLRARTIYEWDARAICPRYGFRDPEECYEALSVEPRLRELRAPVLLVASENDPMILPGELRSRLAGVDSVDLRWARRGGHLGFPRDLELGLADERGLVAQLCGWFDSQRAGGSVPGSVPPL